MSDVTRYSMRPLEDRRGEPWYCDVVLDPNGEFVRYEDYCAALEEAEDRGAKRAMDEVNEVTGARPDSPEANDKNKN